MSREQFFRDERWTAGVIGLGYVGLPLLLTAARQGLGGIGFDVSQQRVDALNAGHSHIDDVSDEELEKALADGVEFTTDPSRLAEADAIFICVPSPLGRNRQPDLSFIEAAAATVAGVVRPGQLISLESTSYPGTTEDIVLPAITRAGYTLDDDDVYLAFSPERVSPGEDLKTGEIPKVVGGVTEASGRVAEIAYKRIVPSVHLVSSARAAEMTKLIENTYRAVNIGLVNEIAQLAHELDIDIWEVIDAAATKPFGFQAFYPGPGVGGHCIPLDPQYLSWRAREANFATRFIDTAEQVNIQMPGYNVTRISEILNDRGLPTFGSEVLGVGISYKANIADDRESASLEVLRGLARRGAVISVLDPLVGDDRIRSHGFNPERADSDLSRFAIAVILTDHSSTDYERIATEVPVVYDARGVYRRLGLTFPNVIPL
ncbi:MAG TPA: nucleotide sugar dehydrogenase [Acidimicrobiia bacterium]|nr:nucleotide sugar dehydrogenase [Acidimicrobiia bacterium]